MLFEVIGEDRYVLLTDTAGSDPPRKMNTRLEEENAMKVWTKPAVREQEVGLEVTSYLPAEIDVI